MRDYQRQMSKANTLLAGNPGVAHLMGIGGVGMAGLAQMLAVRGWQVDGCDTQLSERAVCLRKSGINVAVGHTAEHIDALTDAEAKGKSVMLVHSAAVAHDNPELAAATAAGVAVIPRGILLAACVSAHPQSVAVCGAHGKTTTTLFLTRLLLAAERSVEWCVGGEAASLNTVAGRAGNQHSPWLVVEADESDGTLACYAPQIVVLTNFDADHMDHFGTLECLAACYAQAVTAARKGGVWCADDQMATSICGGCGGLSFGFGENADLRAVDLDSTPFATSFTIFWHDKPLARVTIDTPGRHNVLNALAAMAAAIMAGVNPATAATLLPGACNELPKRRYETVTWLHGCRVVSDYAHHPREITALVAMARPAVDGKLIALFQPHRYSRTLALRDDFPPAFDGVDLLILLPVYAASEAPMHGGETVDLYAAFRRLRPTMRVILADSAEEAWHAAMQYLSAHDLLLLTGAGDIAALADKARACAMSAQPPPLPHVLPQAPLGRHTTLGVGGNAQWLADVADAPALTTLLATAAARGLAISVMGAGANSLVADSGIRGVTIRLIGSSFKKCQIISPTVVEVGCGLSGNTLLRHLEEAGLAGLEFLDGIPGTVGGWLAMNAGAHGHAIGEHVLQIECLNYHGNRTILTPSQCGFGYRTCAGLQGEIALSARLSLSPATPQAVAERRAACRARRIPLAGLRTAGSVFRNPEGGFAGALLEKAGCKGWHVGGAHVCDAHANVIAVSDNATASDVIALMRLMQREVQRQNGITLRPEIRILR